jgi:hypothetical protein
MFGPTNHKQSCKYHQSRFLLSGALPSMLFKRKSDASQSDFFEQVNPVVETSHEQQDAPCYQDLPIDSPREANYCKAFRNNLPGSKSDDSENCL